MVLDQHHRTGRYAGIERAGRVGENKRFDTDAGQSLQRRAHGGRVAVLVVVRPAGQQQYLHAGEAAGNSVPAWPVTPLLGKPGSSE